MMLALLFYYHQVNNVILLLCFRLTRFNHLIKSPPPPSSFWPTANPCALLYLHLKIKTNAHRGQVLTTENPLKTTQLFIALSCANSWSKRKIPAGRNDIAADAVTWRRRCHFAAVSIDFSPFPLVQSPFEMQMRWPWHWINIKNY